MHTSPQTHPRGEKEAHPCVSNAILQQDFAFTFFLCFFFYLISKVFSRKKKNVLKYATTWVNLKNYTKQKKVAK